MLDELSGALVELGAAGKVHVERFGAPTRGNLDTQPKAPATTESVDAQAVSVSVQMDGRRRRFTMRRDGETVLDAATRNGFDLPFACRAGVCATCRARITSGAVEMQYNQALEDWEVDAGFVLCCQARPTSAELAITYDEK
jgi:ring-1,2-phenylacetyl-CoA epoxidase subunit PaaE